MSNPNKEGGCCGTHGSHGPCCQGKQLLVAILIGALLFGAGMMVANKQSHRPTVPVTTTNP